MRYILPVLLALSLLIAVPVVAVSPPQLPMDIIGDVTIDGTPAPVGTVIVAHGEGVYSGTGSVTLSTVGAFGGGAFDPKIIIQGASSGAPITFTINGQTAFVKTDGSPWGSYVSYIPGELLHVKLAIGSLPQIQETSLPTPTPTPTPAPVQLQVQVTQVSGSSCVPPPGSVPPLPSSVVRDRVIPLIECQSSPRYTPPGTGAIYVGAWGSGCMFYINGALMTSGGPVTIRGIPPGTYTISYRETGCVPQDIQVTVGQDRLVYVNVNPTPSPGYTWGEKMDVEYEVLPDRTLDTGVLTLYAFMPSGTSVYIDDVLVSTFPCRGFSATLAPGIHEVEISVGGYDHEFPVMIGAGTNTKVSGGSPVVGISCARNGCDCTYLPDPYYI